MQRDEKYENGTNSGEQTSEVHDVIRRNIEALISVRQRLERGKSLEETIADKITRFTGSMTFVYLHALFFGSWITINTGFVPLLRPFDPFPFVMLAMIASVEAIFLSTFVLISQNRMQFLADKRADLDLQINLLAEHEITRMLKLVDGIAQKLGVNDCSDPHLEELKKDVQPEAVLEEIEQAEKNISP